MNEILYAVKDLCLEIKYFLYLLGIGEIRDEIVIHYHISTPYDGIHAANRYLDYLKAHGIDMAAPPDLETYFSSTARIENILLKVSFDPTILSRKRIRKRIHSMKFRWKLLKLGRIL